MATTPHNNEQILKNTNEQYAVLISKTFGDNTNEDDVIKNVGVPLKAIRRIQFAVHGDVTVEFKLMGINPANSKTILQLAGTGEFVFEGEKGTGSLNINRSIYNGLIAVSTHNVKEGAGYTIVLSGRK